MKKTLLVCLMLFIHVIIYAKKMVFVDFYHSMGNRHLAGKYQKKYEQERGELDLFLRLYLFHARNAGAREQIARIPKIFHWIWVGDKPLPHYFKTYQESFKRHHPKWEFKLWTDKEINELCFINHDLYNQTINCGEKSDIARIAILYEFGGVYVDTDVKCLAPFDAFHEKYDFYAGLGPITNHIGQINNGVIGACKHHPILKKYLDLMPEAASDWHVVYRTGPGLFTRAFKEAITQDTSLIETSIILPAGYFSPLGKKQKIIGKEQKYMRPETFAIHYYYGTWADCPGKIKRPKKS